MRLGALFAATHASGHRAPTGWLVVLPIVVAVLYAGSRTGRLAKLRTAARGIRLRNELRGMRVSPFALVPTALLLIVIVVLVIAR